MTPPEALNLIFESGTAIFSWLNVVRIFKDRAIKGVQWSAWILYTAWGVWDIVYMYPALHMPLAAASAYGRVSANFIWVGYAFYLTYKPKALA